MKGSTGKGSKRKAEPEPESESEQEEEENVDSDVDQDSFDDVPDDEFEDDDEFDEGNSAKGDGLANTMAQLLQQSTGTKVRINAIPFAGC